MATAIHSETRICIVGAHTLLGERLIELLIARSSVSEFWVVDLHPPKVHSEKLHFIKLDLTEPGADARLAEKFSSIAPDIVVHCALKNNPSLNSSYAHELEVIGTLHIVSAVKAAKVKKFVVCSTTAVYGASPKNPNYIDEKHALAAHPESHFIRDKVEAERTILSLQKEASEVQLTVLRFALILGPNAKNYFTELFTRKVVPTLLGFDPLMQFIDEADAVAALEKSIFESHPGIFNIVGDGVIPLSYALREAGKIRIPVASFLAYPMIQALWNLQMVSVPGQLLDYFRYLWVADGRKAREQMGFHPSKTSKEAFLDFAKLRSSSEEAA